MSPRLLAVMPCVADRGPDTGHGIAFGFRLLWLDTDERNILDTARKAWECGAAEVQVYGDVGTWEWPCSDGCPYHRECSPGARCSACSDG